MQVSITEVRAEGDLRPLGCWAMAAVPRVGEHVRLAARGGATQVYRVVAVLHDPAGAGHRYAYVAHAGGLAGWEAGLTGRAEDEQTVKDTIA